MSKEKLDYEVTGDTTLSVSLVGISSLLKPIATTPLIADITDYSLLVFGNFNPNHP